MTMADKQHLLKARAIAKKRKPSFVRQDSHKKRKLGLPWRMPRGIDSKIRLNKRGYRTAPSQGYRSPEAVRHLLRNGLRPIVIFTVQEGTKLNKHQDTIIIV